MQAIDQANNISDKIDFKGFESVNLENEDVKKKFDAQKKEYEDRMKITNKNQG